MQKTAEYARSLQKPAFRKEAIIRFQLHIRRPVCLGTLIFTVFLAAVRLSGLSAADRSFEAVDGQYLQAEGRIAAWEPYGDGIRIRLDHLRLKSGGRESSDPERELLRDFLRPSDSMLVFPDGSWGNPAAGAEVICRGKCMLPEKAANPGQSDSRAYYSARGIFFLLKEAELSSLQSPAMQNISPVMRLSFTYLDLLLRLRRMLRRSAESVFGKEDAALIGAVLLGDRSGLSPAKKRLYREGGLIHILAVSGLHIGFFGRGLYRFLRKRRRSFLFSSLCSAFLVFSYCILTGNSFSAQRASIMFFLWLGSQIAGRTEDRLTSLSIAAAMILFRHPLALQDSSFLLSFSCILSLELLLPLFQTLFPFQAESGQLFLSSLSIQAGTLPLICWFYYQLTPYSIFFQLFVLPFMGLFLVFALLGSAEGLLTDLSRMLFLKTGGGGSFLSAILSGAGTVLSGPCHFLLKFFDFLCRLQQKLPGSVLISGRPAVWQILLYYVILAAGCIFVRQMKQSRAWRKKKTRKRMLFKMRAACAAALPGMLLLLLFRIRPPFRYTCLDVGQGSCNLIEQDSFVCLFDAGSSSVSDVWDYRIEPALKYYGISKVDLVFLSHADTDHINGIEQLLSPEEGRGEQEAKDPGRSLPELSAGSVRIGQIYIPDLREERSGECFQKFTNLLELTKQRRIPVSYLSEGAGIQRKDLSMEVLWPSGENLTGDANQDCIVLKLDYRGLGILLTGDLEKEGEECFIREYRQEALFDQEKKMYTILVAGHHGSRFACSEDMLKLVNPDLVLISCGKNNRYGHPAPELLERLRERGIPWKRTDLEGAAVISWKIPEDFQERPL